MNINYKTSEVICIKCLHRWIAVRPSYTLLKDLECPSCTNQGFTIETGQEMQVKNCIDCKLNVNGKCKLNLGEYSQYVDCGYKHI